MAHRASSLLFPLLALVAVACSAAPKDDTGESVPGAYSQGAPAADAAAWAAEAPGIELDAKGFPVDKSMSGYSFSGCEYWPFAVSASPYPDHIVWGCSPGSSPQAQACLAAGMRRLATILKDPPPELASVKAKYGISSFFNWNNDRFGAPEDRAGGSERIWLYQGRLIKWISGTNRDGTCVLPEKKDLVDFAKRCLEGDAEHPGC